MASPSLSVVSAARAFARGPRPSRSSATSAGTVPAFRPYEATGPAVINRLAQSVLVGNEQRIRQQQESEIAAGILEERSLRRRLLERTLAKPTPQTYSFTLPTGETVEGLTPYQLSQLSTKAGPKATVSFEGNQFFPAGEYTPEALGRAKLATAKFGAVNEARRRFGTQLAAITAAEAGLRAQEAFGKSGAVSVAGSLTDALRRAFEAGGEAREGAARELGISPGTSGRDLDLALKDYRTLQEKGLTEHALANLEPIRQSLMQQRAKFGGIQIGPTETQQLLEELQGYPAGP